MGITNDLVATKKELEEVLALLKVQREVIEMNSKYVNKYLEKINDKDFISLMENGIYGRGNVKFFLNLKRFEDALKKL